MNWFIMMGKTRRNAYDGQCETHDTDWHVEEEDPPPGCDRADAASSYRSQDQCQHDCKTHVCHLIGILLRGHNLNGQYGCKRIASTAANALECTQNDAAQFQPYQSAMCAVSEAIVE